MKQLILLLLLLPTVLGATEIISANTTIKLEKDTAHIGVTQYIHTDNPIGNLTLILSREPRDVKVNINGEKRDCLIQAEFARCGNLTPGEHAVDITYTSTYPFAKVGENTIFKYNSRMPYQTGKQRITLALPIGTIIPREIGKEESFYISPDTAELYSDGERILLIWDDNRQEVDVGVIMRDTLPKQTEWIIFGIISGIIALSSVTYILYTKRTKKTPDKKTEPKKTPELLPQFVEDERKVVELLKKAPNNEAWQKTILQETSFSKAKVSRIIRNLEERGVVVKTIYGNTNKVTLKKK